MRAALSVVFTILTVSCATAPPPQFAPVRFVALTSVSSPDVEFAADAEEALEKQLRDWSRITLVPGDSTETQIDAMLAVRADRMEETGLMSFGVTRVDLSGILFSTDGDSLWSGAGRGRHWDVDRALKNAAHELVRRLRYAFSGREWPEEGDSKGKGVD
jgi:hypothetical protein